jgi:virginiamycin B lyase
MLYTDWSSFCGDVMSLRAALGIRRGRLIKSAIFAALCVVAYLDAPLAPAPAATPITLYTCLSPGCSLAGTTLTNGLPAQITYAHHIVAGPDGALWFANNGKSNAPCNTGSIGRMTTAGVLTALYSLSTTSANCPSSGIGNGDDITNPHNIVVGPDGNIWFTDNQGGTNDTGNVGEITTSGTITMFNDPTINSPHGITVGPDGALWFVNSNGNSIGRITTSGTITNYPDPAGTTFINHPKGITVASDGALWFTNYSDDTNACTATNPCGIGRITTAGAITEPVLCANGSSCTTINEPTEIVAGTDGKLWFTNSDDNYVTKMTVSSVPRVTGYKDAKVTESYGLTQGSGYQWYTSDFAKIIGRIKTNGAVTDFACPCNGGTITTPYGVGLGPDANIWFADHSDGTSLPDYIGVISIKKSVNISPPAGPSGTPVTVYGNGFKSGETVDVDYDSSSNTQICSGSATTNGTFTCSATIPSDTVYAAHIIEAIGQTSLLDDKTIYTLTS